jgi:outer membrane lipoprotein SlyB
VKGKTMTKLTRRRESIVGLVVLFVLLLISLVACTDPPPSQVKPEVTLTLSKSELPDGGGEVILTARVTKGTATSVTFKGDKGAAILPVESSDAAGNFVTTVTVTTTTKFTAQATGSAGVGNVSEVKTVTVAPPDPAQNPVAPPTTTAIKGFANITLTSGKPSASGLSVVAATIPSVTGAIVGQVKAETVKSTRGLDVVIEAGDGVLSFRYPASAAGKDSFQYTVSRTNREVKGKIDIDIQALPSDVEVIDGTEGIDTINGTNKTKILLAKDVTCTAINTCVTLKSGQTLAGTLSVNGVTITNSVKPKIIANMPLTRKSGTAVCKFDADDNPIPAPPGEYEPYPNCTETRVIRLADDVTVEGIEITSSSSDESSSYFIALFADADGDSRNEVLDGLITIKDVTITRSNGKPIYIKYELDGSDPVIADYDMVIEGLTLKDANDTLVISNPSTLTFRNSTIELLQPKGNNAGPQPFGDNAGVQIANFISGDITLDNVDVFMESTRYRIDFGTPGTNAVPFEIWNARSGTTTTLTVKNSDITFGDIVSADVAAFKVQGNSGTVAINESASINNTSKEGSSNAKGINRIGNVSGTIQFK